MRIGFVLPSSHYLIDPFRGDPFTHLQILTVIEEEFENKNELLLIDLRGIKPEFAITHIPECDVYLHSVYTLDFEEQKSIVTAIRRTYPQAKHIAGGPHVNVYPQDGQAIFDSLILGEGEFSVIAAIKDLERGCLKKSYKQEEPVDINSFPHMRRHFLPKSAIVKSDLLTLKQREDYDDWPATTVIFSRGCPFQCHFCAIGELRRSAPGIRYRTPPLVESEIDYLKRKYGIKGISLLDEIAIPLKKDHALTHLEAIGRANIVWRGQCRVDGITLHTANAARESGCIAMGLGVESAVQECLDLINKRIHVQKAKDTIRLLKEAGIEARIYMILGLPGEPEDIVEKTWSFIEETKPDMVYLSLFTIRPGTEVFRNPAKFGIAEISADWNKTMHMYGRYGKEVPTLTFRYSENAPWGKSLNQEQIVNNYLELQERLKEKGLNTHLRKSN